MMENVLFKYNKMVKTITYKLATTNKMTLCEYCDNAGISTYCIKCGKGVCTNCRFEYLCWECNEVEEADTIEKELVARLKPILMPLRQRLQCVDYWKIVQMIRAWEAGKISQGDELMTELRCALLPECGELLNMIERIVIHNEVLPLSFTVPKRFYKMHGGFGIRQ